MTEYIGTQVNVPGTRGKAILRYHGSIHGKAGVFAGLELLGPIALTRGKNNGDVEGFKYFSVQSPMSGLFLPFERLRSVNPNIEYTRDMINEASNNFHNDSLNEDVTYTTDQNQNVIYSPTPSSNSAHESSNIPRPYSAEPSRKFNQSPLLSSGLAISKRHNGPGYNGTGYNVNTAGMTDRSRASSVSSYTKSPILNSNYRSYSLNLEPKYHSPVGKRYSNGSNSFLEQELYDLRSKYERSEREMVEKMSILNELRETVQELQPILKQYETELTDKDKKIAKIRNEFESAREDWRQNLDIMVNTYEANENFYESKIKELQIKVTEHSPNPESKTTKDFQILTDKYNELVATKEQLEADLNKKIESLESQASTEDTKQLNKKISDQQSEIESLSKELMEIHKFPNDDPSRQAETISRLQNEIEAMVHFKEQASTLQEENNQLKSELERRHSFEKLEDKNQELTRLQDSINSLKEQLTNKDKEITQLEDDLDSKVKELNSKAPVVTEESSKDVAELKDDIFFKDQEIKALQQQLDKSNETIASQKQRIKGLEAKQGTEQGTEQSVDSDKVAELEAEIASLRQSKDTNTQNDATEIMSAQLQEKQNIIQELERKLHESLASEMDSLNINDAAAINEMTFRNEIDTLRNELEARPTIEELTELQDNIDEMLRLHNNEIFFKDEEIQRMVNENSKLQVRLERALEGSIMTNRISDNTSHESISLNSELPVYKPEVEADPSAGKDNWCGLCERDGHSSLNCPYENDIF